MAALVKKIICTAKAPAAMGPYSQAVLVDRTMYIAGQLGMDPSDGQLVPGGAKNKPTRTDTANWPVNVILREQSSMRKKIPCYALRNVGEILKAAGCDYHNVVKTTVLMTDMKDFNDINEVYKQFFKCNFPARAAYQVVALPKGACVEIEAIAILGPLQDASAAKI